MPALYGLDFYGNGLYSLGPPRVLKIAFAGPVQHISAVFSEVVMTTPNTTIDSSATVTDQYGALITNLPTATLTVTFPDRTTSTPNVTNMGSGVYTATYVTKGPGLLTELWSFIDVTGAVAQEQHSFVISY